MNDNTISSKKALEAIERSAEFKDITFDDGGNEITFNGNFVKRICIASLAKDMKALRIISKYVYYNDRDGFIINKDLKPSPEEKKYLRDCLLPF